MTKANQQKIQKKSPNTISTALFLCVLSMTAIALFLSLLSFSHTDSSLIFDTTEPVHTANWLGAFGAHCAGMLLYFFGSAAFLIPIQMLFYIHIRTRIALESGKESETKPKKESLWKANIDRIIGFALMLPLSSTIAYLYSWEHALGISPGGLCGYHMANAMTRLFGQAPLHLFLFMLTWATGILVLRFSFIQYLYPLGYLINLIPLKAFGTKLRQVFIHATTLKKHAKTESADSAHMPQTVFKEPAWEAIDQNKQWNETLIPAYEQVEEEEPETDPLMNTTAAPHSGPFVLPSYMLFPQPKEQQPEAASHHDGEQRAATLEHKLERFGIKGKVVSITQGPVVTLFEYQPSIDTKISTIVAREDDLALALQALSLRIIAPIPGRSVIGFEVAHAKRRAVLFYNLLKSSAYTSFNGILPLILGKDTLGNDVVIDLASLPHLLVAGSTGSGKSVGLHAMIMSLLCSKTPDEIKFILIDPKRLEFSAYADIAHLLFPIVTDPSKAIAVLKWAVATMEDRYVTMAEAGVRNAAEYNSRFKPTDEAYFPSLVIIIDELADLMMTAGKDVEGLIARLAQMARAAGIHLMVATQRPSVDVITGLIKVNFPSRIAYKVTSKVDSRTILDGMGAEKLLGKGDMLFLDSKGVITRVHGAYVTDTEIATTVKHIKAQRSVSYTELISMKNENAHEDNDEIMSDVIDYLKSKDEISISLIQRVFRIGYNRSARLIDQLEASGYILPNDGGKMRKVNKEL